jgi:hypothetical protein
MKTHHNETANECTNVLASNEGMVTLLHGGTGIMNEGEDQERMGRLYLLPDNYVGRSHVVMGNRMKLSIAWPRANGDRLLRTASDIVS